MRPPRALIFDSVYDTYRGVVTYVRVVDGKFSKRERMLMMSTQAVHETLELGVISPEPIPSDGLGAGEVGYVISGVKDVRQARVGDTITTTTNKAREALAGYDHPKPMVFSGLYPVDGDEYPELREALDKLQLNDAALVYEPETSTALGFGFRCGFLGLLHMEIVRERLEREFDLSLISTAPNVVYRVVMESGRELTVTNPSDFPGGIDGFSAATASPKENTGGKIKEVYEPVVRATVISPSDYIGTIMELCQGRRGVLKGMDYLSTDRVEIRYTMPLAEIIFDFFDQLKSRTRGYASLDYEPEGEQVANLVKVDILLQGQPVDAFSQIVHSDNAREYGLSMTAKLKELIPRQQFEVPIQAAVGSRIIARENIRALRKDVLAKCYGGDITRKRKLLEKQKEGKKRMKTIGRVEVPQEAFVAALSTGQAEKNRQVHALTPWAMLTRMISTQERYPQVAEDEPGDGHPVAAFPGLAGSAPRHVPEDDRRDAAEEREDAAGPASRPRTRWSSACRAAGNTPPGRARQHRPAWARRAGRRPGRSGRRRSARPAPGRSARRTRPWSAAPR